MRPLLFTSVFLALALPASAHTQRHTVLDYYKTLPERFFNIEPAPSTSVKARLRWLRGGFDASIPVYNRSVVDIRHDFMRVVGDGGQPGFDIAIFRFRGQETVAVGERYGSDEELSFWRLRGGHLVEVTKQVFPFRFGDEVNYVVPRYGTTIGVYKGLWTSRHRKVLARLVWGKGRFRRA